MKHFVRNILRKRGFDVVRYPLVSWDLRRRMQLLANWKIGQLLDVGANEGQYAAGMRKLGYSGKIVSFEPLDIARQILEERSAADIAWHLRPEALGDTDGDAEINVAGNSQSSSLLDMKQVHLDAAPESKYVGIQKVKIRRLSGLWDELGLDTSPLMLKIDAQGYEKKILEGCMDRLNRIKVIQLEMSLTPMYEGEADLEEMLAWVKGKGFTLVSLEPGFEDKASDKLLQVDGIFQR